MKNKKRVILFSILACLAATLVLVALFMPMVRIVAHAPDDAKTVVFDKPVSFLQYLKENPFVFTAAEGVYFNADGPIWMSTTSILLNLLVGVFGVAMFVVCILEIILCAKDNLAIKNNVLAKKISLFTGWLTLCVGIFAFVSFMVTTMLSNGYAEFYSIVEVFMLMGIGLAVIVLAHLTGKRQKEQAQSKLKNSLGFALIGLFSLACFAFAFIPQYSEYFMAEANSMWQVASQAVELEKVARITEMSGTYPFGFAQWAIILLGVVTVFLFIYSLIGFILALAGKKTNWLSSRVKRWSMVFLVVYTILYVLILAQHAVMNSTFIIFDEFETFKFLTPQFFALMFAPLLPYAISTMISVNKKSRK
ncbi:MAG: hypothetical protein IJS74_04085 [Clostridia bacterium]|nr:hypothetical protein [Clostridia bacterium]